MDWIANILIVLGLYLIGNKQRSAFLFSICGEFLWVIWSIKHGMWSLAFICTVFCLLALRSYVKWGNDENRN